MLLARPAFTLLWCSRILSNVAFNMLGVAVGWQLYALTGSALDLGLVGLAQFAPIVLLTLVVGQVADRYDRRLIAAICQLVQAGAAAVLVEGSAHGWLSSTSIFAIVALIGAARAFENPTTTALVSDIVPRARVSRAMAWLVSATQTARIVGPALGGFLYVIGPSTTYLTAAVLFVASGLSTALIRTGKTARTSEPVVLESVLSGSSSSAVSACCWARCRSTCSPCSSAAAPPRSCPSTFATFSAPDRVGSAFSARHRRSGH